MDKNCKTIARSFTWKVTLKSTWLLRVYGLVEISQIKRSINFNVPARPLRTPLVFHAALRADPIDKVHQRPNLFTELSSPGDRWLNTFPLNTRFNRYNRPRSLSRRLNHRPWNFHASYARLARIGLTKICCTVCRTWRTRILTGGGVRVSLKSLEGRNYDFSWARSVGKRSVRGIFPASFRSCWRTGGNTSGKCTRKKTMATEWKGGKGGEALEELRSRRLRRKLDRWE